MATPHRLPLVDLSRQHAPLRQQLLEAATRVIDCSAFVGGSEVRGFEEEFARFLGARECVAVGSGTDALELALRAAGIGPGDEVITAANTFVATVEAIALVGARPVLADVDPLTFNLDPADAERRITARTRAILPVHLYGQPADMGAISQLAAAYGLAVVEDACQAHGASWGDRAVGTLGLAGCFSFYPGKNLGALGDGGAVVSSDPELAARLRRLRNHGGEERYEHREPGRTSRLDGVQAALLRVKLPHLRRWNAERAGLADLYARALEGLPVESPRTGAGGQHVFHLFVVRSRQRDHLLATLREAGVEAAIHYPRPVHLTPAFHDLGTGAGSFPAAEAAAREILSLPLFPGLTEEEVLQVVDLIRAAVLPRRGREVSAQ